MTVKVHHLACNVSCSSCGGSCKGVWRDKGLAGGDSELLKAVSEEADVPPALSTVITQLCAVPAVFTRLTG